MNADEFIQTRSSLLQRLENWQDQESWREFFDTYGKLIYSVALKAGLSHAEAQDVVQDTVLVVARKIPDFEYDRARGSFKSWLLLITRRRIEKQLKKRLPAKSAGAAPAGTRSRTATVEKIPDPAGFDLEGAWAAEWEKNLSDAALARVKRRVKARHFQMFDLYVLKQWPVREVARALGVSVTQVYVNKHRICSLLKQEVKRLAKELR